ncbi:hypothetical protein JX266_007853 [Neoarthrinium moseri]|nr:hypothetical protein JX266_007853 [Neoarthrinium moseri]
MTEVLLSPDRQHVTTPSKRALDYDFAVELTPGTWKVIRKKDRFEFLAQDVTEQFQDCDGDQTWLGQLLDPCGINIMGSLMRILNHENLINCVDWIKVRSSPTGRITTATTKQFVIWDFCNAGTLENLLMAPHVVEPTDFHRAQTLKELEDKKHQEHKKRKLKAKGGHKGHHLDHHHDHHDDHHQDHDRVYDDDDDDDDDDLPPIFLPEAFCWHVLCSVLKALAWLHHGIREDYNSATGRYETQRADLDWQTMLHRDIRPSNIFFCHPQTKHETYGLCKLGNYGAAVVSGVFNGIHRDRVPPARGKALAPQPGRAFAELDELRRADAVSTNSHPPPHTQPYTMLSEYRSLADVVAAMMVEPTRGSEANTHFHGLRDAPGPRWRAALEQTGYTGALKNFVYRLMATTTGETDGAAAPSLALYRRARAEHARFRGLKDEGRAVITADHVRARHAAQERGRLVGHLEALRDAERARVAEDTSDRFVGVPPPTALDDLLDDIYDTCAAADAARYDTEASA